MKVTYAQIEKALDNSFQIGVDGDQDTYEAIRLYIDQAIDEVGPRRSREYYYKSDWKIIYRRLKELLNK